MKKSTFAVLCACISTGIFGQNNPIPTNSASISTTEYSLPKILNFLERRAIEEANNYCKPINNNPKNIKLTSGETFVKKSREVFSTVVTANSDAVENGSAFAYVKDKDANTLSVNGAVFLTRSKLLLDMGVITKLQSKDYNFYADETWSNDVSGTFGVSWMYWSTNGNAYKKSKYITPCLTLKSKRNEFLRDSILSKYQKLNKWTYDPNILPAVYWDPKDATTSAEYGAAKANNDELKLKYFATLLRIETLNNEANAEYDVTAGVTYKTPAVKKKTVIEITTAADGSGDGDTKVDGTATEVITISKADAGGGKTKTTTTKTEDVKRDIKKELAAAIEARNTAIEIMEIRDDTKPNSVQRYMDKRFDSFDSKNDNLNGYSILWSSAKVTLTNSNINVNNDVIVADSIQEPIKNLFKLSLELSGNFTTSYRHFFHFKGYTKLNRGSLLDSKILIDGGFNVIPEIAEGQTAPSHYGIYSDSEVFIANYDQLKHPVYNMDIGFFSAWLPIEKKSFGFLASTNFNFPIKCVQIEYKPSYSVLGGLLMKAKKDAVIIQLLSGFENQYHDENAWDGFVVKASVGVPFTIFEKPKKA